MTPVCSSVRPSFRPSVTNFIFINLILVKYLIFFFFFFKIFFFFFFFELTVHPYPVSSRGTHYTFTFLNIHLGGRML